MTLFSEIYGAYFRIAAAVLERESLTAEDIGEIVSSEGFRESVLFVPRKLIPGEDSWSLLREEGKGRYTRTTKQPPVTVITELQKRWLKSKLSDPKLALFLTDEELRGLEERLKDTEPLYTPEQIRTVDAFSDGDDYTDPFIYATVPAAGWKSMAFSCPGGWSTLRRTINSVSTASGADTAI